MNPTSLEELNSEYHARLSMDLKNMLLDTCNIFGKAVEIYNVKTRDLGNGLDVEVDYGIFTSNFQPKSNILHYEDLKSEQEYKEMLCTICKSLVDKFIVPKYFKVQE